jgi:hypothetical protein
VANNVIDALVNQNMVIIMPHCDDARVPPTASLARVPTRRARAALALLVLWFTTLATTLLTTTTSFSSSTTTTTTTTCSIARRTEHRATFASPGGLRAAAAAAAARGMPLVYAGTLLDNLEADGQLDCSAGRPCVISTAPGKGTQLLSIAEPGQDLTGTVPPEVGLFTKVTNL